MSIRRLVLQSRHSCHKRHMTPPCVDGVGPRAYGFGATSKGQVRSRQDLYVDEFDELGRPSGIGARGSGIAVLGKAAKAGDGG